MMSRESKDIQDSRAQSHQDDPSKPRQLDLAGVPYLPLPPSPSSWEIDAPEPPSAEEDLFEYQLPEGFHPGDIQKIQMEDRPDPAYKSFAPMDQGCLLIDKTGRASAYDKVEASILFRSFSGSIESSTALQNDIYRYGTSAAGRNSIFLSSDCILHGYDGDFKQSIHRDLKRDPRVQMMDSRDLFGEGEPIRRRIRSVAVSPDGERIVFTVVDTAFCIDSRGKDPWAVSMPLGDRWERVLTRSKHYGDREEVDSALDLMGLKLPVTQNEIKKMYRQLSLQWHPDRNPSDPGSTSKMQRLNHAFEILTGVDAKSLEISGHPVLHYRRTSPDMAIDAGGFTISVSSGHPSLDWIYTSGFAFDNQHVYVGSYSGKIVRLTNSGLPTHVIDVGNVPRRIVDTADYLFIRTDSRLYLLDSDFSLVELVDIYRKANFIVTPVGFGMLANNNLQWFSPRGEKQGEIRSKHPIRAAYTIEDALIVETRQHKIEFGIV